MTLAQAAYFAADHMDLWVPGVVAALAGFIIGLGHLVAIAARDR